MGTNLSIWAKLTVNPGERLETWLAILVSIMRGDKKGSVPRLVHGRIVASEMFNISGSCDRTSMHFIQAFA